MTPTMEVDCPPMRIERLRIAGIATEARLPEPVADDRGRRARSAEFLAGEAAAERRAHSDDREEVVEQQRRENTLGDIAARDVAVAEIEGGEMGERLLRLISAYSAGDSASTYVVSGDTFGNVTPTEMNRSGCG